ncbi:P-type ATPase4, putative [Babesia bigemina]|uniref:P-type sodium-transporting ATPase4 n=1 Tax=Babesia bigemina TaxID=5866 RepID=A0A061D1E4_BABBI|nr:P-type ATPase4, putative [Babesia bigemina]CDR94458.1 P-type ATPase4, putative [Babesia bigemina]|eukprot:XP_012766644.1 P-type ATPase4, putative [Babesia bigemina]
MEQTHSDAADGEKLVSGVSIEMQPIGAENNAHPNVVERAGSSKIIESIATAISKSMIGTSITNFADGVEGEIAKKLSYGLMTADSVIELARMKDESVVERATEQVQQSHPSGFRSKFSSAPVEEIVEQFGLHDLSFGLSTVQSNLNRDFYGKNILEGSKKIPLWYLYISQFFNFVVIMLLVAAVVSIALGNIVEGVFIVIITNVNAAMATYMEKSAANALEKLAEISSPTTTVVRDGQEMTIDSKDVVPGDVVILKMGDTVPADMRLFEVNEIRVNEALLTGEPEAVKKDLVAKDINSPFATNLCFASTSVVSGSARGVVISIGMETQVGHIAKQLKKATQGNDMTPLQSSLNSLGGIIGLISIAVLVSIIIVAIVTKYEDPTRPDTNRILSIVLLAVGFAVSSIPEGLPMVVTISLSIGASDMAKRNANIRKLPAVETLGCCSVICSDKTGTLTEGKMTTTTLVVFHSVGDKWASEELSFYPTMGFNPHGGLFQNEHLTEQVKADLLQCANEERSCETAEFNVCGKDVNTATSQQVKACMLAAYLNSNGTRIEKDEASSRWKAVGNMTESPLIVAAAKCGIGSTVNPNDTTYEDHPVLPKLEVPFNSSRKMMCTVHKLKRNNFFGDIDLSRGTDVFTHVATLKGAPDMLFDTCRLTVKRDADSCKVDWESLGSGKINAQMASVHAANSELSSRALRVLLVGVFPLTDNDVESLRQCQDSDERLKWLLDGGNNGGSPLVLLGCVGSLDPPRFGVKSAIETCVKAGVRVVMITGDQKRTAAAIGKEIGLFNQFEHLGDEETGVLECSNLHISNDHSAGYLPDEAIDAHTARVSVFCRAQPEDKVAIVESLKRQGYLTAMTGDGVNDAPALKTADIGVAMGINGTDVAKGASDMVLLDDNFCTIVSAIESGRTIYANIQKFVSFLLGTNIGEIIYLTASIIIRTLPPVEAMQILFLNIVTDGCPAVALSREPSDADVMTKKPRPRSQPIMTRDWWLFGNLPHTIFEAAMVICSILVGLYVCTGVIFMSDIHKQCSSVTLKDASGNSHNFMYFCKSYEYRVERGYVGWVTNINYFDVVHGEIKTALGAIEGKQEILRPDTEGLWKEVASSFKNIGTGDVPEEHKDKLERDEHGWFRPKSGITVKGREDTPFGAAPHGYFDITARKSTQARTISFITAVWCEMLRAYTVRSWDYFYRVFNRSPVMHIACGASATVTFVATVVPRFNTIMHLVSLPWWQYLLAVGFAMVTLVLDECVAKVLYRRCAKHEI